MNNKIQIVPAGDATPLIRCSRGQRDILDWDLASLYKVEPRALVQALKRNIDRFPEDFHFQLTPAESAALRSQSVISKPQTPKPEIGFHVKDDTVPCRIGRR